MNTEDKPISAYDSVYIDKQLATIPEIVSKYDNYFFAKDQLQMLRDMKEEIDGVFDSIFKKY
jgi:hypothetical protein